MKILVKNEIVMRIFKIFEFFKPEYFRVFNSLLLNNLIKNNWDVIKKMKGNISNIIDGEFIKAKNKVK